jgi:hypothetical protein
MSAGIVFGAACYEHQLAVIIGLSAFLSWLVCGKKNWGGIRNVLFVGVGWAIGFSPRFIYAFSSGTPLYVEPFNNLLRAVGDARMFAPYFLRMVNGTVIYLRNVGCVTYKVVPLNGILFIGASILLLAFRRRRLYRALLLFTLLLYLLPFAVIKYTAIRYFLCALFGAALITGLGLYELSLRYRKTAVALLAVYCGVNIFYLCANFIVPFARTGGNCVLFKMGNLVEASHHLVRSDVLYNCLDKNVPVVFSPEPFISNNLRFYDVTNGYFETVTNSIGFGYDDFYFIDYAPSKLGIEIDPGRFPAYQIKRECRDLKNFSVYRFHRKTVG